MNEQMCLQVSSLTKPFVANCTLVRHISNVSEEMCSQVPILGKPFETHTAFVRFLLLFLFRVNASMPPQQPRCTERSATGLTLVWLLPAVSTDVCSEALSLGKRLEAHIASV